MAKAPGVGVGPIGGVAGALLALGHGLSMRRGTSLLADGGAASPRRRCPRLGCWVVGLASTAARPRAENAALERCLRRVFRPARAYTYRAYELCNARQKLALLAGDGVLFVAPTTR